MANRPIQEEFLSAETLRSGMVVRFLTFWHPFKGENFVISSVAIGRTVIAERRDKRGQYDRKRLNRRQDVPYWQSWSESEGKFKTFMCPHFDKTAPDCRCLKFK
jgi:hypothetical protein